VILFKNIYRHKALQWSIKLLILILLLWFSYQQIFERADFNELKSTLLSAVSSEFYILLVLAVFLMFLNWSLEAEKWRRLMRPLEIITFRKALASIFAGVTLAIFTPNRIGEYGGRMWLLKEADPGETVAVTILGSLSQLLITFLLGSLALLIYVGSGHSHLDLNIWLLLVLFSPLAIGSIYLYFDPKKLLNLLPNRSFLDMIKRKAEIIETFDNQELRITLGFSLLRYLVFTAQYLIFLKMFGVGIDALQLIPLIMQIFLFQTIVPTFAVTELGIRGGIALSLLGALSLNKLGILSASFGLWFLNLMLPALIGLIFIFRKN